jgi:curli biogenesis system outer membrane secretion channel CsgG
MNANRIFTFPLGRVMGLTLCSAALTACCSLSAQPTDVRAGPHKPPAEALAACQSLSSGAVCNFTSPHGAMTGTCWAPEGKSLACKPKDAPTTQPNAPKQ